MTEPTTVETTRAQVLRQAAQAPQFSWQRGWHLVADGDDWLVLSLGERAALTQAQVVSAGSVAQLLVLAREAQGRRSALDVLPRDDRDCVVRVLDTGPVSPTRARLLLTPHTEALPRSLQPSDVRHLNLAAEAFGCELLWQDDLADRPVTRGLRRVHATADRRPLTTVVTPGDGPREWLNAGRAVAQCELVAHDLGLGVTFSVHPFASWSAREEIRQVWGLRGWPQAQFSLLTPLGEAASDPTPRPE